MGGALATLIVERFPLLFQGAVAIGAALQVAQLSPLLCTPIRTTSTTTHCFSWNHLSLWCQLRPMATVAAIATAAKIVPVAAMATVAAA